jgi:GNAT superfamily N-acetyltransferase
MGEAAAVDEPSLPLRIRRALGRIRRRFTVDIYDVFTRDVGPEHATFEDPDGYRFVLATPEMVASCEAFHTELEARDRELGVRRLGIGHAMVAGLAGDTVVFSMWINPRNLNVPGELKRKLGAHQSFIYKAYTSPEHRGKGLYKLGMRFVLHELARAGKRQLVGYAHVKKDVSRKGLAALEFGSRGRYYSVRVMGWQHTIVSSALATSFPESVARSGVQSGAD